MVRGFKTYNFHGLKFEEKNVCSVINNSHYLYTFCVLRECCTECVITMHEISVVVLITVMEPPLLLLLSVRDAEG